MDNELYLKLPCALGSKVYSVGNYLDIDKNDRKVIKHSVITEKFKLSMFDDIGTKYFLSYDEAERRADEIGDFIYNESMDSYYNKDGYIVITKSI